MGLLPVTSVFRRAVFGGPGRHIDSMDTARSGTVMDRLPLGNEIQRNKKNATENVSTQSRLFTSKNWTWNGSL